MYFLTSYLDRPNSLIVFTPEMPSCNPATCFCACAAPALADLSPHCRIRKEDGDIGHGEREHRAADDGIDVEGKRKDQSKGHREVQNARDRILQNLGRSVAI